MRHRAVRAALLAVLAAVPFGLAGCLDFLPDSIQPRPDYAVARTAVRTGPGDWNTDSTFVVQVSETEPLEVVITATPDDGGAPLAERGFSDAQRSVTLEIPDGTWTIAYSVDGYAWETFRDARFDGTPPAITGLESFGSAPSGAYTLGRTAVVEGGADVRVVDQSTGGLVAIALPAQLFGLADGVHAYDVEAEDDAGNQAVYTVQVVAGAATKLPDGQLTMGIVARYRTTAVLWDITDMSRYLSPSAARAAMPGFTGSGVGITPDAPAVQEVVDQLVTPGMSTAQVALVLYEWVFDELDYDKKRLNETDLLDPEETIAAGGGVCRDLAALYVSLLRAAGVPSRLVAGYLGGIVNGFHAWVEFYGGLGPMGDPTGSKWVPVDVSGITGAYEVHFMLQAFGVRQPDYLMMRAVTTAQEQTDWASAMTLSEQPPPGRSAGSTDVEFETLLSNVTSPTTQKLCINRSTYFREFRSSSASVTCPTPRGEHIPNVITGATQVLDYGVRIRSGPPGARITLELVYPDLADNTADQVEFLTYAPNSSEGCPRDASTGRATCVLQR